VFFTGSGSTSPLSRPVYILVYSFNAVHTITVNCIYEYYNLSSVLLRVREGLPFILQRENGSKTEQSFYGFSG
jgi:hypothetical protein